MTSNLRKNTTSPPLRPQGHITTDVKLPRSIPTWNNVYYYGPVTIKSYGIILIRPRNISEYEFLLIQSKNSYSAGCIYAGGNYLPKTLTQQFVDQLTDNEKRSFLMDGAQTGYSYYLSHFDRCHGSRKYINLTEWNKFRADRLAAYISMLPLLKYLINKSQSSGYLPWSFAKGRPKENELHHVTAIREFTEESGSSANSIKLLSTDKVYKISYLDGNIYEFNLYFAEPLPSFKYRLDPSDLSQTDEVSNIRWMTRTEFASEKMCEITARHLLNHMFDIEETYLAMRGMVRYKPVSPSKPVSVLLEKPVSQSKPVSVSPSKPVSVSQSKPVSVSPSKPVSVSPEKPTPAWHAKIIYDSQPSSINRYIPPSQRTRR